MPRVDGQAKPAAVKRRAAPPRPGAVCVALLLSVPALGQAAQITGAEVVLEVLVPGRPGDVPEAAPPRFVLLEDRTVYVGGSSQILTAKLDKGDVKPIEKLLKNVRKIKGLAASITLGPGEQEYRLWMRKSRPQSLVVKGSPSRAPRDLRPLARLLTELEDYHHPRLRLYRPTLYGLRTRGASLAGGCRSWNPGLALPDPRSGPVAVPARVFSGWPTGRRPASVCSGEHNLVVTLRPLLPGETP